MCALPSVSVVICAHASERWTRLQAALASLANQSVQPFEVIVVIDHNPELMARTMREVQGARILSNEGSRGLSGARNSGWSAARGEIVAFVDDDAEADPNWIAQLASHYKDSHIVGVGGAVVPVWAGTRPRWLPSEFDWVVGCSYNGQPVKAEAVRNVIGCNMSFRRGVLGRVEGFREGVGRSGSNAAGCEETEFCIRLQRAYPGSRIMYDPSALVLHHVSTERTRFRYFVLRCMAEGRSKAQIVGTTGSRDGLASERGHVARVLPAAVLHGVADVLRGDMSGIQRAGAVLVGTALVVFHYVLGRSRPDKPVQLKAPAYEPVAILDIDVCRPLPTIRAEDPVTGSRYGGVFCLVRSSEQPIGVLELPLYGDDLPARALEAQLEARNLRPAKVALRRTRTLSERPFARLVIATRDRPLALVKCLDSALDQDCSPFEIVVVDSAPSNRETADLVSARYKQTGRVQYRREDRPGLGRAHNCGIAEADAPVIAFTDDDVLIDKNWLAALLDEFVGVTTIGCATGLILPAELETRAQFWTERHGGFGKGFERRVFDLAEHRSPDPLYPFAAGRYGSGANMAFSRHALQSIGGFDAALGAGTPARGGDDLAAFVAVVRAGYQLVYQPNAIVWHHHRRTEEGMRRQAFGYGVGLGAYLTKVAIEDPATILHFARAAPAAVRHLTSGKSTKNNRLPDDYPKGLQWAERWGVLAGFPSYLRSRAWAQQGDGRQVSRRRAALWSR